MTPKKQTVTLDSAMSKGKTMSAIGGHGPPPVVNQPHTILRGCRQQLTTAAVQKPDPSDARRHEGAVRPVKSQSGAVALDRENVIHE